GARRRGGLPRRELSRGRGGPDPRGRRRRPRRPGTRANRRDSLHDLRPRLADETARDGGEPGAVSVGGAPPPRRSAGAAPPGLVRGAGGPPRDHAPRPPDAPVGLAGMEASLPLRLGPAVADRLAGPRPSRLSAGEGGRLFRSRIHAPRLRPRGGRRIAARSDLRRAGRAPPGDVRPVLPAEAPGAAPDRRDRDGKPAGA